MSSLFRMVQFVVGLALVAAGAALAAPYVCELYAAHARTRSVGNDPGHDRFNGPADGIPGAEVARQPSVPASYAAHSIPDPRLGGWEFRQADLPVVPAEPQPGHFAAQEFPAREYSPPVPPAPLPQVAAGWSQSTPPLDAAYRSTVDVPPPPLLDADTPPPLAVAWTANDAARGGAIPAAIQSPQQSPPTTYVVRDGDDLTGIAAKIYGHPGAAGVIWSFNRDRLTDPALLPIGMELRIPPSWHVPAIQGPGAAAVQTIEPARRPAKVRVAPGETLEMLAQRFYGDRAMAARLWEANRDQLRNPALLVAGMELRLP
jgi:nucleoid-associated protein YgaU